jgi:two-component system, NarL family, invasion response regulator UvrY
MVTMEPAVAVMVVDDQEPFRQAARALLGRAIDFELVAEAASGEEAVKMAAGAGPELVLMDIHMPGIGGIEATRQLLNAHPEAVVFLCSTYPASDLPAEATTCGARGYVDKAELGTDLLARLWAARDNYWFSR